MKASDVKRLLDIPTVLDYYGKPYEHKNNAYWFKLRDESQASCKAILGDNGHWVWFDHGSGEGGTVIDLIWQLEGNIGQTDLKETLEIIKHRFPSFFTVLNNLSLHSPQSVSPSQSASSTQSHSQTQSTSSSENKEPSLVLSPLKLSFKMKQLLWEERKFTPEDLEEFGIKLVKYQDKWRLGAKNISNGWELFDIQPKSRGGWKMALGPKDISILRRDEVERGEVIIVESPFDVVATYKLTNGHWKGIWVSLNTTAKAKDITSLIEKEKEKVTEVVVAVDRDEAGDKAYETIEKALEGVVHVTRFWCQHKKDPCNAWLWKEPYRRLNKQAPVIPGPGR